MSSARKFEPRVVKNGGEVLVEEGGEVEMVPPDGGWGWVIVFASCIILGVTSSMLSGFGIVYVYLVAAGYSNAQVVGIPAVLVGFTNLLGPISTGLSRYYTSRTLATIGVLTASLGVLLCSFYANLVWFYFCYGVLGGLGSALATHQGFLICQQYFRKKRVTAQGFSLAGASLGFMVTPPFIAYLVQAYSSEGTFMIWSSIILNGIVGAALFHPVSWHLKPERVTLGESEDKGKETWCDDRKILEIQDNKESLGKEKWCDDGKIPKMQGNKKYPEKDEGRNPETVVSVDFENNGSDQKSTEMSYSENKSNAMEKQEYNHDQESYNDTSIENIVAGDLKTSRESNLHYDTDAEMEQVEKLTKGEQYKSLVQNRLKERIRTISGAYDDFGSALSLEISLQREHLEIPSDSSDSVEEEDIPHIICGLKFPRLKSLIRFSLFKNPAFLVTTAGSLTNRLVYSALLTYMPAVGYEAGLGELAPYLLTILAACELAGKIIMSVVSDQNWLQRRYIYCLASFSCGLSNILITFGSNFATLGTLCGIIGFGYGTIQSLGGILLVEYLGVKILTWSYGLLLFSSGLFGLILMPFTGWLVDVVGNYTTTFYVLGALNIVPVVLWLLFPLIHKKTYRTDP